MEEAPEQHGGNIARADINGLFKRKFCQPAGVCPDKYRGMAPPAGRIRFGVLLGKCRGF